jgi:hypothetical protein
MSDFCYSQPMLKRVLRKAEQMDRMLQCVGVDPARLVRLDKGMVWYEARLRCIACIHDDRCHDWIAERLGQTSLAPPAFCPNAELFASLADEVSHEAAIQAYRRTWRIMTAVSPH